MRIGTWNVRTVCQPGIAPDCELKLKEDIRKQFKQLFYLGSLLTIDGKCDVKIKWKDHIVESYIRQTEIIYCKQTLYNRNLSKPVKNLCAFCTFAWL